MTDKPHFCLKLIRKLLMFFNFITMNNLQINYFIQNKQIK